MKPIKRLTLGIASLAVFTSIAYSTSFAASNTDSQVTAREVEVQTARTSVANYIEAIEKQDEDEIVKWVKDTRFKSEEEQKSEYKEMFKNDPFDKVVISGVKKVDDNMIVSLKLIRKGSGKRQFLDLPVIKEDGKWKILVTGVETKEEE
ncbi:hypothetical protein [Brevibacillus reuszeri]|uniref:hypothetical protein n=1 Tax=Brevibacillus reuszeri TaxID=54915 RepID=UPI003D20B687